MDHERGVALWLIEPGKPAQSATIQRFNGRPCDECLNEHGFQNVMYTRTLIESRRREYNEERPKRTLGGRMPAAYAKLIAEIGYLNSGS